MDLSLQIVINEQGETRDLALGETTTIGRSGSNRIQIRESYISSEHATINRNPQGGFILEDCGSKNGTFINDAQVFEPTPIEAGDILRFGLAACRVVDASVESTEAPAPVVSSPPPSSSAPVKWAWDEDYKPGFIESEATKLALESKKKKEKARSSTKPSKKPWLKSKPGYDPFADHQS